MTAAEAPPVDPSDPFAVHFHREPLGVVDVAIVVLTRPGDATAGWEESLAWLRDAGRAVDLRIREVDPSAPGIGTAIQEAADAASTPIVAVVRAVDPPSRAHWEPLFQALDQADHVVGSRPAGPATSLMRRLARIVRRAVFGVPILDVDSPLSLHRTEKLRAIPLQSGSSFAVVELLAKSTFLGHILDEPAVPALAGRTWRRGWLGDLALVFKAPTFRRAPAAPAGSGPAEPAEGEPEGPDGPGREDRQGAEDAVAGQAPPLQDDQA